MYRQIKTLKRAQLLFSSSSPYSLFFTRQRTYPDVSMLTFLGTWFPFFALIKPFQLMVTDDREGVNPGILTIGVPPRCLVGWTRPPPSLLCRATERSLRLQVANVTRCTEKSRGRLRLRGRHPPSPSWFFWVTAQSQSLKVQIQKPPRSGRRGGGGSGLQLTLWLQGLWWRKHTRGA